MPSSSLEKILLIPDCHVPYEDGKAFDLMLRAAKSVSVKRAVILGDFADFYCVSSHSKDPRRRANLFWEVEKIEERLDQIEKQFGENVDFIEGNHCDRLSRYLAERAPELFDSVKVQDLFHLKRRGWGFTPYKAFLKIGKLHLTHDLGKAGPHAHRDAMAAFQGNAVIGHTHRMGYTVEGSVRGKAHIGAMFGWLGDFDQVDYMHKARARRDWVHGFGMAYLEKQSGAVHLVPHPIVNGKVVIEGKLVR